MDINTVVITGNLGKEPEVRSTANGTTIMQFNLAVSERRKVNNDWTDYTHWIPCVMIGTRAESLSKLLHKGSKIGVTGKLNYSSWKNDNGETRSKVEIKVFEVELLSPKKDGSQGRQNAPQGGYQKDMGTVTAEAEFGVQMQPVQDDFSSIYDEDIPF